MTMLAVHKARRLKWTPPTWDDFATAANAFEPQLRAAFLETLAAATKRVDIEELGYALEQRDFDRAASLLLGGRPAAGTVGWAALDAAVRVAIWRAAVRTGEPLAVAGLIRSANPNALTAIRFQALNLIQQIDESTREGIRAYVTAQLAEGKNPRALIPEIAGRVRANGERTGGIVGLTERQALAVRNYRANLEGLDRDALQRALRDKRFDRTVEQALASQQALEPAYIDKLVTRYESNMRAYRAETIARTESMRALAEGQRLAWDTAFGEDRADRREYVKTWYTAHDERVRPEHAEMEGVTVDYDEDFEPEDTGPIWGPPVAPQCRCVAWIHPREVEEFGPPPEDEEETEKSAARTLVMVDKDWDEAEHPRVPAGSPEGGEWTSGEGGGGGESAPLRTFTSEEGYRWHEENPAVQQWVRALSPASSATLLDYAGFGYSSINDTLRGRGPTKDAMLRPMTLAEVDAVQAARSADKPDPEPPEGRLARYAFDWEHGGPSFWQVRASVPDEERRARARAEADQLEAVMRKDGFILPEALQVGRGAYLPGVSEADLRAKIGQVYEEPGFTSTMLGNAGGRLDGYAAWAKWESINQRFSNEPVRGEPASSLVRHQDEVGTAIRFTIDLPAGARVAPIEAVRQEKQRRDDEKYGSKSERRRFESEVLLGRGGRFRILGVAPGPTYKGSDPTLKPVKLTDVHLRYLGGEP